jgi:ABC-2 type transport system ATP-binding protein
MPIDAVYPNRGRGSSTNLAAMPVLEARSLSKRYGGQVALSDVSFSAERGELVACIGPNGAGKTTLLTILAGIQRADVGTVERPPSGKVGWVPQQAALYGKLSAAENLALFARLEGVDDVEGAVDRMLVETGLGARAGEQVSRLSGGNRQRLNIAVGLLSAPAALLLDEPSSALDPRQRERLWDFILELSGAGTTVVYATHNVVEAERYAGRVLVLADGERLFWGAPAALHREVERDGAAAQDFEAAFVSFLRERGH